MKDQLRQKLFSLPNRLKAMLRAGFFRLRFHPIMLLAVVALLVIFFQVTAKPALAEPSFLDDPNTMKSIIGFFSRVFFALAYVLGWLAAKVFSLVVLIAGYQDIVGSPAVTRGWVIIRDMVNMVFVVILLFIAFAEIFQQSKFSAKAMLPKVLMAAIAVNFSKLFCALIIDACQVVMLTFVNGFAEAAGGNLVYGLGLLNLLRMDNPGLTSGTGAAGATPSGTPTSSELNYTMLTSGVLACIMLALLIFVSFFIAAVLAVRIAYLWFLVATSPFGIVFSIVKIGKLSSYASKWWDMFYNYVTVGPFMAFFLWLSLLIMSTGPQMLGDSGIGPKATALLSEGPTMSGIDAIAQYAFGISMLVASLMMAQQAGGMAGSIAGSGMGQLKSIRTGLQKFGQKQVNKAIGLGTGAVKGVAGKVFSPVTDRVGAFVDAYKKQKKTAAETKKQVRTARSAERGTEWATTLSAGNLMNKMTGGRRKLSKADDLAAEAGRESIRKSMNTRVTQDLKRSGVLGDVAKMKTRALGGKGISDDEQRVLLLKLAEKGRLDAPHMVAAKKVFKDKESYNEFEEKVKGKQIELAYDYSDPKVAEKIKQDYEDDVLKPKNFSAGSLKNEQLMRILSEVMTPTDFVNTLQELHKDKDSKQKDAAVAATTSRLQDASAIQQATIAPGATEAKVKLANGSEVTVKQPEIDAAEKLAIALEKALIKMNGEVSLAGAKRDASGVVQVTTGTRRKDLKGKDIMGADGKAMDAVVLDKDKMNEFASSANVSQHTEIRLDQGNIAYMAGNLTESTAKGLADAGTGEAKKRLNEYVQEMFKQLEKARRTGRIDTDWQNAGIKTTAQLVSILQDYKRNAAISSAYVSDTKNEYVKARI